MKETDKQFSDDKKFENWQEWINESWERGYHAGLIDGEYRGIDKMFKHMMKEFENGN